MEVFMTHYHRQEGSGERPAGLFRGYGGTGRGIRVFLILLALGGCDLLPGESSPSSKTGSDQAVENSGSSLTGINNPGALSIMTWNTQALFDGAETGTEYDEYLEAAGWGEEKYTARLNSFSRAIDQIAAKAPDILALQETENSLVLEKLAQGSLSKYGYQWTFFANNPGASLGIGILSRFPLTETRVHSITWDEETTPRPILEVWLQPRDKPLVLLICHWKSKLGGDSVTESLRRASARVILRRIREIGKDYPDMPVIVMGDLNENHDEFYRQAGSIISALIPDDPKAAELAGFIPDPEETEQERPEPEEAEPEESEQEESEPEGSGSDGPAFAVQTQGEKTTRRQKQEDYLILSGEKPPVSAYFHPEATVLYSPWGKELQEGSYYYKNAWETIDHFLLTPSLFDGEGWDFDSSFVVKTEPFVNSQGYPNTYNPRTGNGLSDHLPLMLILKTETASSP
jgi:endonuclease/exonuclease/phosphatase family metal-dependent hydrolase